MTTCARCGSALPKSTRVDARFCSGRCRTAAHRAARAEAVPAEMRQLDRWVSWSSDKAPRQLNGRLASSTNPSTWTSWRQVSTVKRRGFVLNGDGIVCLDLDHCLDDGKLAEWAVPIVTACSGTYVEVSPSGTGLHIFGHGEVRRARKIRDGRCVEVYGRERYMTVTGVRFRDCPSVLADIGAALPV